jgi:hypothetical protein
VPLVEQELLTLLMEKHEFAQDYMFTTIEKNLFKVKDWSLVLYWE